MLVTVRDEVNEQLQNWCDCHRTPLMKSKYWFRKWLSGVRQQDITWTNVDPDLYHHMVQVTKVPLPCCYLLIAKPGNRTGAPSWLDPYVVTWLEWVKSFRVGQNDWPMKNTICLSFYPLIYMYIQQKIQPVIFVIGLLTVNQHCFKLWLGMEQSKCHYLKQCWTCIVLPYNFNRPQWVKYSMTCFKWLNHSK